MKIPIPLQDSSNQESDEVSLKSDLNQTQIQSRVMAKLIDKNSLFVWAKKNLPEHVQREMKECTFKPKCFVKKRKTVASKVKKYLTKKKPDKLQSEITLWEMSEPLSVSFSESFSQITPRHQSSEWGSSS